VVVVQLFALGSMSISRPTKSIVSGLIFVLLVALIFPNLPRARVGQETPTWDAGSYAFFVFIFVPLLCIWFGAGRNRFVEALGWILLLFLTVGGLFG